MSIQTVNPFRDVIVADARRPEPVVTGLNEEPLRVLRERFAALAHGPTPRPLRPAERALLVFSEEPGYGKSHLISRLFREMHTKASLVYVQPFQDARTPFLSLMLALVRELHFPDRDSAGAWNRDEPSQLDFLAHAVWAHTMADFIEGAVPGIVIEAPPGTADEMRADPLGAFQRGQNAWAETLRQYWDKLEKLFNVAFARRGLDLKQPEAWLRVLRTYAFAPFEPITRRICTDWMCGLPIDREDAVAIGLRPSEAISGDISPEETNRLCRERLHDLSEFSAFFRPTIFCFDQTEVYCGSPALAHSFGTLVATLVHEMRGHLCLVTANQSPWEKRLAVHMEDADRQRLHTPALFLQGMNRAQAEELVRLRMRAVDLSEKESARFLAGDWFRTLYPAATSQLGARAFLQKCDEAWAGGNVETADLSTLFDERRDQILSAPKRHVFEPDTLQWLIESVGPGLPDVEASSIQEKYAAVRWTTPERTCFFGFVPGSNWRQWQAIAQVSQRQRESLDAPCKFIFFRVPGQQAIPGATWQIRAEIDRARAETLHIVVLSLEELADLYAPRELYAAAAQGDIPFSTAEVLRFIQERLAPYWARFTGPVTAPVDQPPEQKENDIPSPTALAEEVRSIVESARFLSLEDLLARLQTPGITREAVLAAAGFCSEIRLHIHPGKTVLQWQPGA